MHNVSAVGSWAVLHCNPRHAADAALNNINFVCYGTCHALQLAFQMHVLHFISTLLYDAIIHSGETATNAAPWQLHWKL